ncbi:UV radiation resistance-associated gene protein-like isoform X2 [Schistocerca gregaria]|uniref:UV radiation resistance-associated gene protein-like isoform X2 n=1 Tax=Schistocerca gregaria TaxID=7010 RepID=UPI00211DF250|nr:UV radiation resistance-associated gene protein-like isoform X2 [Schistocerca gregaria]
MRHLKRFSVVRLSCENSPRLYNSFFSLHEEATEKELSMPFYISEVIFNSVYPQWHTFSIHQFLKYVPPSSQRFTFCVWDVVDRVPVKLLLRLVLDLTQLAFISTADLDFPENTLLVKLHDGLYCTKSTRLQLEEKAAIVRCGRYLDSGSPKWSCCSDLYAQCIFKKKTVLEKLKKIEQIKQRIDIENAKCESYFTDMKQKDYLMKTLNDLKSEYEDLNAKHELKKQDLEIKTSELISSIERLRTAQVTLATSMRLMSREAVELKKHHTQIRTEIISLIHAHQRRLFCELATIYKIEPVDKSIDPLQASDVLHKINDLPLDTVEFYKYDQEDTAMALGYVCHVIQLISKYLDVPIRYPIRPAMGRSTILCTGILNEQLPLYSKAQNLAKFKHGLSLLNKNVEQLLLSQGINPFNARHKTLFNIRMIFWLFTRNSS